MGYIMSDKLDHEVMFVAACSSFMTLFILSIFNKCHYIKHDQEFKEEIIYDEIHNDDGLKAVDSLKDDFEEKKDGIFVSESLMESLCKDMIRNDFYIHEKKKDYFSSDNYLNLIPRDRDWVNNKIKLLNIINVETYSERLHNLMLDNFDPLMIEPKDNICIKEIQSAFKLFNEWRRWPIGDGEKGWKFRTKTKENTMVYTHILKNSELDIVKSEQIFPFTVSIVIGVLMNEHHFQTMDPSLKELNKIHSPSTTSHILHLMVKTPPFIGDRDFLNVAGIYILKDGGVLISNSKCDNKDIINRVGTKKGYVRGEITLSLYHIRPNYDDNIQHTKVTFYSHCDIKGSIPSWILNNAYMETAKSVPNLKKYITSLYKKNIIHKPGQLWIPPKPYMEMMGINI